MAVSSSTYYGLTRIREMSPDAQDWAVVDGNVDIISKILKALEQHVHSGTTSMPYPGYNGGSPIASTLTEYTTGGILPPGATLGIRLAYVNSIGLETDASPETTITTSSSAATPIAPSTSITAASPGLSGGTYTYVITKRKGTGETTSSEVVSVSIPYDASYSVTVGFDAINSYSDGTDGIYIYRSSGLNQPFQLVTTVTTVSTTTYVDTGSIPAPNVTISPPTVNTFDANRKVRISWASIGGHPTGSSYLRVYVTQQSGLWSTQHLLREVDLTGSPPTYTEFLGNESLSSGWPRNVSQIPSGAPKVNLGTEATGAPSLTADMSFQGYQAKWIRLHNNSGAPSTPSGGVTWPQNGAMYYDSSVPSVRAYINGGWVNWGTTAATAYTHPVAETGGHNSANIWYSGGAGTTAKDIFDRITTSGARKQVQPIYKTIGSTAGPTTTSNTWALIPEMTYAGVTPDFTGQYAEANFSALLQGSTAGQVISWIIEYDGATVEDTWRSHTVQTTSELFPVTSTHTVQLGTAGSGKLFRVLWQVSTGTATAVGVRRSLVCKVLF